MKAQHRTQDNVKYRQGAHRAHGSSVTDALSSSSYLLPGNGHMLCLTHLKAQHPTLLLLLVARVSLARQRGLEGLQVSELASQLGECLRN